MKIGDKVRFLSDVGGGVVAGFQGNNIVLVEDEDGFQVPTQINDVVVVGDDDYSTKHLVESKKSKGQPKSTVPADEEEIDPADRPITFKAPVEERKGGNMLSAYLAFVPMDARALTATRFETYFVNDSNYYLRFVYMSEDGANWKVRATAEVEPNTKLFVEEFGRDDLNDMERVCVQMVAYKREKTFILKPAIDVQLRIDTVKFYKLHSFQENDFFEQEALLYAIVEQDKPARTLVVDADRLKQEMVSKTVADSRHATKPQPKKEDKNAPIVVDLHANEILDSTAGMTNGDILNYQLDVFRKTLKENEKKKGQKIVFIHGKGEGVLRKAITDELRYRYKQYPFQDASFREYGFGATQVTIK